MAEDVKTHAADDPNNPNNLVVRGADGDPVRDPNLVSMTEYESYERIREGLAQAADACMHLAKQEPEKAHLWKEIGALLDKVRLEACKLAGIEATIKARQTEGARGNPYAWKRARLRFLDGLKQATGGMRQLATCFRGDFRWSYMAQQLERREEAFRALLVGRTVKSIPKLILPPGFSRH